jgi:hypothetical protein
MSVTSSGGSSDQHRYAIGGKWLDLLKEVAPRIQRAAILRESDTIAGRGQFGAIRTEQNGNYPIKKWVLSAG